MDDNRLQILYKKHISDSLDDDEFDEFIEALEGIDASTFESLFTTEEDFYKEPSFDQERLFIQIDTKINEIEMVSEKVVRFKQYTSLTFVLKVAAAIILFVGFSYLMYSKFDTKEYIVENDNSAVVQDSIRLGLANIEFADGKFMEISDLPNDTISYKGISILKLNDHELAITTSSLSNDFDVDHFHMFAAKGGSTLKLTLPDRSVVQLNSGSSINISASFGIQNRKVLLRGEGYFEVARDKELPFVVDIKGNSINVLGTIFNISGYNQDNVITTTLLEGSLRVDTKKDNVLIKPGQQAQINSQSIIRVVNDVDISKELAWLDGVFRFKDESIEEILVELSKWYFIKYIQVSEGAKEKFTGSIKRTKQLKDVLEALEQVSDLKIEIQEGRVKVMK